MKEEIRENRFNMPKVWIIRYSNGKMNCYTGTETEVREKADKEAKEMNANIEFIG